MILKLFLLWLASVVTIVLFFMGAFPRCERERPGPAASAGCNPRNWN